MSVLVDNIFVRKIVSVLADNDDIFGQCWQKLSVMVHIKITLDNSDHLLHNHTVLKLFRAHLHYITLHSFRSLNFLSI